MDAGNRQNFGRTSQERHCGMREVEHSMSMRIHTYSSKDPDHRLRSYDEQRGLDRQLRSKLRVMQTRERMRMRMQMKRM